MVVERVKGIDEELVERSCVGSAEWSVVQESSFTTPKGQPNVFGLLQPSAWWLAATPFAPGMGDR